MFTYCATSPMWTVQPSLFSSIRFGIVVLSCCINRIEFKKSPRLHIAFTRTQSWYNLDGFIFLANKSVKSSIACASSTHRVPPLCERGIKRFSPNAAIATILAQRIACSFANPLAFFIPSVDFINASSMANSIHSDERRSRVESVVSSIVNVRVTSFGTRFFINPKNRLWVSNSISFISKETPLFIRVFNSLRSCSSLFNSSFILIEINKAPENCSPGLRVLLYAPIIRLSSGFRARLFRHQPPLV